MGAQGGVTLRITTTPQGQGHRTVAAQVAADVLGLEPEQIDVRTDADTAANPWTVSSGNYSSRFAAMGASAVHLAATRLADRLRALAAPALGCAPEDVELARTAWLALRGDGRVRASRIRRLAGAAHWHPSDLTGEAAEGLALTVTYTLPISPPDDDDRVNSSACYGFVADVCVVEIDPETAEIAVRSYVTVHDAGRLLNPLLADGQVRGGLAHGLGAALLEEHRYDEDGNLMTATFLDYLPPTATELPRVVSAHLESPSPLTPLGAKGLGEGTTMSAPAAIANAVADALGVEHDRAAGDAAAHLGAAVKPSPLRLERPRSLEEALALLAEHGDDAKVIAGGQSLVPLLNFRLAAPAVLVDLNQVPALALIDVADGSVRVGALCPQRELERHAAALAACPLLRLALPFVGHVATRNRGTVGGSIAHADAAAELPLLLQTLAGEVEVTGPSGARLVPAEEFFVSHLTSCLEPDEIVTEVRFPVARRRLGRGLRRGRAAPRRLRGVRRRLRAARRGRGRDARRASAPARCPTGRCGWLRPSARSWATRCEPEALAGRRRGARAPSTRATACTPPPSTAGISRACSRAGPRSAPTRWRRRERARRSPSTGAACTSSSTIACCCPTSCATRSACAARTSAASTACAAPARCSSTAAPCAPA